MTTSGERVTGVCVAAEDEPLRRSAVERQNANPTSVLLNHNQCPSRQFGLISPKSCNNYWQDVLGKHAWFSQLQDARAGGVGQSQHGPEIEVVRKHDTGVGTRPRHDFHVGGTRIADCSPVNRLPAVVAQQRHPLWRQVHVDEDFDRHVMPSGSSRSSNRQAA